MGLVLFTVLFRFHVGQGSLMKSSNFRKYNVCARVHRDKGDYRGL